jgi:hypothetical protein
MLRGVHTRLRVCDYADVSIRQHTSAYVSIRSCEESTPDFEFVTEASFVTRSDEAARWGTPEASLLL